MCDKIGKLLSKIRLLDKDNKKERESLDNELNYLLDYKFSTGVKDKKDKENIVYENLAIRGNLMLSKSNEDSLYFVRLELNAEEFEKIINIVRLAYCTSNVGIAIKEDKAILVINCRSESEVYVIFRLISKYDIKFENLFINKFMKSTRSNQNVTTYGASFTKEIIEELLNSDFSLDEAIMDNLYDSLVVITNKGTELKLEALKNLAETPVKHFADSNNLNTSGEAFTSLAFSLYNVVDRDYSKYVILFTYTLLNTEDKKIKRLLDALSITFDPLERIEKIVEAFEKLDFVNPDLNFDAYKMNIQSKMKEAIEKEEFDNLNTIMDIVCSTFILCMTSVHVYNTLLMYSQDTEYIKMN